MKTIKALVTLALIAVTGAAFAASQAVTLIAHNQRSSSGTRSALRWLDCGPTGTVAPCFNPGNPWVIANGVTSSTATWEWDAATGVLSSTGLYWAYSSIGSSPLGSTVLADRVVDLVIDTVNDTTTASDYRCIEGTFLVGVGANGCGGWSTGLNGANDSSVAYNVGGDPYCIQRTLGGDDALSGGGFIARDPRGVTDFAGGSGCDPTNGAFTLWTLVQDNLSTGGTLILSNGICIGAPGAGTEPQVYAPCTGANWMTFTAVPLPAVGWLLAPAFGLLAPWGVKRKANAG